MTGEVLPDEETMYYAVKLFSNPRFRTGTVHDAAAEAVSFAATRTGQDPRPDQHAAAPLVIKLAKELGD